MQDIPAMGGDGVDGATPPMRVLLVDDEPQVTSGLARMLRMHRDTFSVVVHNDPAEAVQALRTGHFDAVLTDYRMPTMNGADLLQAVHDLQPHCARLVLSGHVDPQGLTEVAATAHQFISKPASKQELVEALHRARRMVQLLPSEAVRTRVLGPQRLSGLPTDLAALEAAMDSPAADSRAVAEVVGRSPGLAAKVLQLVNSSFFGPAVPISGLPQAVAMVGTDVLRAMARLDALVAIAPGHLGRFAAEQADRAGRRAAAARDLATTRRVNPDLAFSTALLQDVGLLLLAELVSPEHDRWLAEAESQIAPADHAAVGAYLLGLWGLPVDLVDGVAAHGHPPTTSLQQVIADAALDTDTTCPLIHDPTPTEVATQ